MKRNYIYASFLAATLALAGCQDMDTLPDGGLITSGQKDDAAD